MTNDQFIEGLLWFTGAAAVIWFILVLLICSDADDYQAACFGMCEHCFDQDCKGCPERRLD